MNKRLKKMQLDGVFVLLLTAVLAICLLAVLLTGAGSYRRLTQRDQAAYDRRTALQYVANQVRQADALESVTVGDFEGVSALCLSEQLDGATYETHIYSYDGYLRELFAAADAGLSPADGEKLLALDDLQFTLTDGLLQVEAAGGVLRLSLRSEGGGVA